LRSVRSELFDGDGTKLLFRLGNKFSTKPTVEVDGSPVTVGIDYLDDEASFDCFWDFNQKYIRFKVGTVPGADTDNIEVEGIPLFNLVIQVEDPDSILEYGIFEFAKTNKELKSREEAVSYARAELEAYKDGVVEGGFETYESGLRSGQVITVTSTLMDISEDFLIQSVHFLMKTVDGTYLYKIKLATMRTIGLTDFLISLIKLEDRLIEETGDVILEKTVFPIENVEISDDIDINTDDIPKTESIDVEEDLTVQALDYPVIFVAGPCPAPDGYKRVAIADGSRAG